LREYARCRGIAERARLCCRDSGHGLIVVRVEAMRDRCARVARSPRLAIGLPSEPAGFRPVNMTPSLPG
jgi:hypothetical protein